MVGKRIGRANESHALSVAGARAGLRGPNGYERLMRVTLRHSYYNAEGGACSDFEIFPTKATAALMRNLGLLFYAEADGFSVLYDTARAEDLIDYLWRQGEMIGPHAYFPEWPDSPDWSGHQDRWRLGRLQSYLEGQTPDFPYVARMAGAANPRGFATAMAIRQFWTRLSFVMVCTNPYFVNITNLPIDTNPAERNFFFANLSAHRVDDRVLLNKGLVVDHREMVPTKPPYFVWAIPDGDELWIRDLSGQVVMTLPTRIPSRLVETVSPDRIDGDVVRAYRAQALERRERVDSIEWRKVQVNLTSLPEDRYVLEVSHSRMPKQTILYTVAKPLPMAFIDLLFTDPTGSAGGIYPVSGLGQDGPRADAGISPVEYALCFEARRTTWTYFIIPQSDYEAVSSLRIECTSDPAVQFEGPIDIVLPNDERGYAFVSTESLALRQQSDLRFRLWGRRRGMPMDEVVLIDCLPVASNTLVRPSGPYSAGSSTIGGKWEHSDIFVYV